MRHMRVPMDDRTEVALFVLARRELRNPKDQATYLLIQGLRAAGVLEQEPPGTDVQSDASAELLDA